MIDKYDGVHINTNSIPSKHNIGKKSKKSEIGGLESSLYSFVVLVNTYRQIEIKDAFFRAFALRKKFLQPHPNCMNNRMKNFAKFNKTIHCVRRSKLKIKTLRIKIDNYLKWNAEELIYINFRSIAWKINS